MALSTLVVEGKRIGGYSTDSYASLTKAYFDLTDMHKRRKIGTAVYFSWLRNLTDLGFVLPKDAQERVNGLTRKMEELLEKSKNAA